MTVGSLVRGWTLQGVKPGESWGSRGQLLTSSSEQQTLLSHKLQFALWIQTLVMRRCGALHFGQRPVAVITNEAINQRIHNH